MLKKQIKFIDIASIFIVCNILFSWCENLETEWSFESDPWENGWVADQHFYILPNIEFLDSLNSPVGDGGNCIELSDCSEIPFSCDVVGIFTSEDELLGWAYYGPDFNTTVWIPFLASPQNSYVKFYDSSSGNYYYGVDSYGNLISLPGNSNGAELILFIEEIIYLKFICNPGDTNADSIIDILDIVQIVNTIIDDEDDYNECGDINLDQTLDVFDIILIINIIIGS